MSTTELCMHELDPTTCSVCKYANLPPVYVCGRSGPWHADIDCADLAKERAAVEKRNGVMVPLVARPGSPAVEGRKPCPACT